LSGQVLFLFEVQFVVLLCNCYVVLFHFFIAEFYEEALSLVYDLTSKTISPDMWKVLELIYQVSV
jgi:hypothetical protein